jgi:hypothetical protein
MYNSVLFYSMPRSGTKVARRYVAINTNLHDKGEISNKKLFDHLNKEPFVATLHSYIKISPDQIIDKSKEINSKLIILVRPNLFDFVVSSAVNYILNPEEFLPGNLVQVPNIEKIYEQVFSTHADYTPFKISALKLIQNGGCLRFPPSVQENFDNKFVSEYSTNETVIEFKKRYAKQFQLENLKNLKDWAYFCALGKYLDKNDLTNIKEDV